MELCILRELLGAQTAIARKICGNVADPSRWELHLKEVEKDVVTLFGQDAFHPRIDAPEAWEPLMDDLVSERDAMPTEFLRKLETFDKWANRPEGQNEGVFAAFREYVSHQLLAKRTFFAPPPKKTASLRADRSARTGHILDDLLENGESR